MGSCNSLGCESSTQEGAGDEPVLQELGSPTKVFEESWDENTGGKRPERPPDLQIWEEQPPNNADAKTNDAATKTNAEVEFQIDEDDAEESSCKEIEVDLNVPIPFQPTTTEQKDKHMMSEQLSSRDGFFFSLDGHGPLNEQVLSRCGINLELPAVGCETADTAGMIAEAMNQMYRCIVRNLDAKDVLGVVFDSSIMDLEINDEPLARHLWQSRGMVPFLTMPCSLAEKKDGVQLIQEPIDFLETLEDIVDIYGIRVRSLIKSANLKGIKACVEQQFRIAKICLCHNLVPMMSLEVCPKSTDKVHCEEMLLDVMMDHLMDLGRHEKVILELTLPTKPNLFLPLHGHPNTIRVAGTPSACSRPQACRSLSYNAGIIASFGLDTFLEGILDTLKPGLRDDLSERGFGLFLGDSCRQVFKASERVSAKEEQLIKVNSQAGFIVDLGRTITHKGRSSILRCADTKLLKSDGQDASNMIHQICKRIMTNPKFNGHHVIGVIIHEESLSRKISGLPTAQYLWKHKNICPFLKIDQGLLEESNGVQLMKELAGFDHLLDSAAKSDVFGVKVRALIKMPNEVGIKSVVKQLFTLSQRIIAKGLIPMLQAEVVQDSPHKAACERMLHEVLIDQLGGLRAEEKVMINLTIPDHANVYLPLISHPRCARVTSLGCGLNRVDSCKALAQNIGIVACFGVPFVQGLGLHQSDDEFTKTLAANSQELYDASVNVPTKELQMMKLATMDGIFVMLDQAPVVVARQLKRYGVQDSQLTNDAEMADYMHQMRVRMVSNSKFTSSRIIAIAFNEESMNRDCCQMPLAKYLWEMKQIVPFVSVGSNLAPIQDGVRLLEISPGIEELLDKAAQYGMLGTRARSLIRLPDEKGITAALEQQFMVAQLCFSRGLVPIFSTEVDSESPQRVECEQLLVDMYLESLDRLKSTEKVILWFTVPSKANAFMPLMYHPNTLRLVVMTTGLDRPEAVQVMSQQVSIVAGFGRPLMDGLHISQSEKAFTKTLDESIEAIYKVSKKAPPAVEQLAKVTCQQGFFMAFDQSLEGAKQMMAVYGITEKGYGNDVGQMLKKAHGLLKRIVTNERFHGGRVVGVILGKGILERDIGFMPCARYCWEQKQIVPFLRIDNGLASEANGVRLLQDIPDLDELLDKSIVAGVFGIKLRAVIKRPSSLGIKTAIEQLLELGKRVAAKNLVPMLSPEVDADSDANKAACERILRQTLMTGLKSLGKHTKIILQVAVPSKPGTYASIVNNSKVLRLVAIPDVAPLRNANQKQTCEALSASGGLVGCVGQALAEGFNVMQTEREFTQKMQEACQVIYQSTSTAPSKTTSTSNTEQKEQIEQKPPRARASKIAR